MIVRPRPGVFQLFTIIRGSVITRIYPQVLAVFALSALVVWGHRAFPGLVAGFSGAPFALLGIALSVFLGFRNNACYDRWWEARKAWGQLIATSRAFARQTLILDGTPEMPEPRRRLLTLTIAFAHALAVHLRPGHPADRVDLHLPAGVLEAFSASRNPPDMLLRRMAGELAAIKSDGGISDIEFRMLDDSIEQMGMVQAICERIRHTPVPFGYTLLLHRTAYLFCLLLPFGFADVLGWATPFSSALVAYTFFGLDALGDELEEPFGTQPNALPISALADMIEINLREAMGETDLPPAPLPRDYILM
ncbi:MAG: bestrophin family ion channel [Parvibaculaceae bacterium]|nr:bestrophin family ion channel [Parvibaculaceae bacterium]